MPSQLCCLLLPSNPLPWETSVLSVTSHTAPSASPIPCQTDPKAMATSPNYRGQNTSMFKCITHFYGIFPCITILPFPLPAGGCRGMDRSCLAHTSVVGWIESFAASLISWVSGPKPTSSLGWAPFLLRQETLTEYNHHASLGSTAVLKMEGEEISRSQLCRCQLLISMNSGKRRNLGTASLQFSPSFSLFQQRQIAALDSLYISHTLVMFCL